MGFLKLLATGLIIGGIAGTTAGFFAVLKLSPTICYLLPKYTEQKNLEEVTPVPGQDSAGPTGGQPAMKCKDLLSVNDVARIIGMGFTSADISIVEEEGGGGNCGGDSFLLPDCKYNTPDFKNVITFSISSGMACDSTSHASYPSPQESYNQIKNTLFGGSTTAIAGVGAEAAGIASSQLSGEEGAVFGITILSSNKKYFIPKLRMLSQPATGSGNPSDVLEKIELYQKMQSLVTFNNLENIGKIIDKNLNNY